MANWRKQVFEKFRLYGVTDLKDMTSTATILKKIEAAYRGGTDIVQLRSKTLSDVSMLRIGARIRTLALRFRKLFFVNDRIDLAIAVRADGVHLGQSDLPVTLARMIAKRAGLRLFIGKSTHSITQARNAVHEGADYIGVGPVFKTPTKPNKVAVGLRYVSQSALRIKIPWVAIGGIDLSNVRKVLKAGARRIAVVRAIFEASCPEVNAFELKKEIEKVDL